MESTADRLKRVAGKHTLTLTHYGRKSAKPYRVTIWFVVDGEKSYLGTANVNRDWVRNVQKTPRVGLSIGAESFDGEARHLTDLLERNQAAKLFRRKYWMFAPVLALGPLLAAIGIIRDNTGFFEVTLL